MASDAIDISVWILRLLLPEMQTSLAERAYLSIRKRTLRGQLPLGEPLSRRLLPVDDAMRGHVRYGLKETVSKMQTQARLEWRLPRALTVVKGG